MGNNNTRNHGVAQVHAMPSLLSHCHKIASMIRSRRIERDYPLVDLPEQAVEGLHQQRSALSMG